MSLPESLTANKGKSNYISKVQEYKRELIELSIEALWADAIWSYVKRKFKDFLKQQSHFVSFPVHIISLFILFKIKLFSFSG